MLTLTIFGTTSCSSGDDPVVLSPIVLPPVVSGPVNLSAIPDNTAFTPTTSDKAARPTVSQTIDVLAGTDRSRLTVELTPTFTHTPTDATDVYPVTLDQATKNLVTRTGLKVGVWTATYKVFETANPANSMTKIVTFTVFYDTTYDTTATTRHSILFYTQNTPFDNGLFGANPGSTTNTKLCGKDKNGNLMVLFDGSNPTLKFEDYHSKLEKLYSHYINDVSLDVNLVFSDKYIMVKRLRYNNDPADVYRYVYDASPSKIVSDTTTVAKPTMTYGYGLFNDPITVPVDRRKCKIYWVKL